MAGGEAPWAGVTVGPAGGAGRSRGAPGAARLGRRDAAGSSAPGPGAVGAPVRVGAVAADVELGGEPVREPVRRWRGRRAACAEQDGRNKARNDEPCPNLSHHGSDHRRAVGELATWRANLEIHALDAVEKRRRATDRPYLEFQRSPDLSTGLYTLPVGGVDQQGMHTEDEIYCVIAGRALVSVGDERIARRTRRRCVRRRRRTAPIPRDRGGAAAARRVRPRGRQSCEGRRWSGRRLSHRQRSAPPHSASRRRSHRA